MPEGDFFTTTLLAPIYQSRSLLNENRFINLYDLFKLNKMMECIFVKMNGSPFLQIWGCVSMQQPNKKEGKKSPISTLNSYNIYYLLLLREGVLIGSWIHQLSFFSFDEDDDRCENPRGVRLAANTCARPRQVQFSVIISVWEMQGTLNQMRQEFHTHHRFCQGTHRHANIQEEEEKKSEHSKYSSTLGKCF